MGIDEAIAIAVKAGWQIVREDYQGETVYQAYAPHDDMIVMTGWTKKPPEAGGVYRWRCLVPFKRDDGTLWCNADVDEAFPADVEFQHASLRTLN